MNNSLEVFDPSEFAAVAAALEQYAMQCRELLNLLRQSSLMPDEQEEAKRRYSELKGSIKRNVKSGTVNSEVRQQNRSEVCFFSGAVSHAASALAPATSTTQVVRTWAPAVVNAEREFSYYLNKLHNSASIV